MAQLVIQSAKFKRDIVVYCAVGFFFLVVSSEIALAIFIPLHLRLDRVWATQVARQELFDDFDHLRNLCAYREHKSSGIEAAELNVVKQVLNRLADYLHRYGRDLSRAQCAEIAARIAKLNIAVNEITPQNSFTTETVWDETAFLATLRGRKP